MADLTRKGFLGLVLGAGAAMVAVPPSKAEARVPAVPRASRRLLLRGADVITMDRKVGDLALTDVLVADGRIAAIGKNLSVADAEVVPASRHILMPGMVDGHRHVWETLEVGQVSEIRQKGPTETDYETWKFKTMVCYTPEDAHFAEYLGGLTAIDSGVTAVVDYCHIFHTVALADGAARGLQASGISGTFCYQVSHTPSYGRGETAPLDRARADRLAPPDEVHWQAAKHLREQVFSDSGLLRFGLATSNAHYGNRKFADFEQELRRIRTFEPYIITQHFARKYPFPKPGYVRDMRQYVEAGLLGPDYLVSHGNGIYNEELEMIAAAGVMVSASPMGEFRYPDPSIHGRAKRAGVATGISTDAPLVITQDYFDHLRAAYYNLFRTDEGRKIVEAYGSDDLLHFATGEATASIRLGGEMGRIAVGQRADLVLLRTDRLNFPASGTLSDRVVNYARTEDVDSVWIAGVARKRDGRLVGVDMARLKAEQHERASRLAREAATVTLV